MQVVLWDRGLIFLHKAADICRDEWTGEGAEFGREGEPVVNFSP